MDFGLSRITRLIRDYHPQLPWKAIHIAGTNGKGSTSAYLSGLLHRAGTSVGRFNSPHLIHRHDCISINEKPIDKDLFLQIENEIKQRNDKADIQATSFELLTATAFEAFARAKVAVGIIECGLGGARDATNVLSADEVICSIITTIAMDHADVLGDDIQKIAREKAGIMKKGVPVVIDAEGKSGVRRVLDHAAKHAGSKLQLCNMFEATIGKYLTNVDSQTRREGPKSLDAPPHQLKNLAFAYDAFKIVREAMPELIKNDVSPDEAMEVAANVRKTWRGRMEWIDVSDFAGRHNKILLDGAHNPQAAKSLRKYVDDHIQGARRPTRSSIERSRPVTWVIAMSSTKDIDETLSKLIRGGDRAVFTQFGPVDGMPWVKPAAMLSLEHHARKLHLGAQQLCPTPEEAIQTAVQMTPEEDAIVVTGSLYLVADVLRIPQIGLTVAKDS